MLDHSRIAVARNRREPCKRSLPVITETRGGYMRQRSRCTARGGRICTTQDSMYIGKERRRVGSNESEAQQKRKGQLRQGNREREPGL